uniref:Photosystem I reaction center subunit VIII n=1 Tax=Boodleopsis sp. FL1161 TaxID=2364084 RepID=A0A386AZB6_9CHLO|nr:photosystem I reaction center subunit VIII [Boodleopsis sp. FL1161]
MTAIYLPEIFVPLIGLCFPVIIMASTFIYIERLVIE